MSIEDRLWWAGSLFQCQSWDRTLASPWCMGGGVLCLPLPMSRAPPSRVVCWSQKSHLPESVPKWDSYDIRPIACPIQLNQNQQASLSQYISSFKIFIPSLCPSHLSSSVHPRKRSLCAHTAIWMQETLRKSRFTNVMSHDNDWFWCLQLTLSFQMQGGHCWEC